MKRLLVLTIVTACLLIPMSARAEKIGGGDLTFTPRNALPVVFSHKIHVTDKGLHCADCHYHIFQMAQGSYEMVMSDLTKGGFCGKCHDGRKAFDVRDHKNCVRCHR